MRVLITGSRGFIGRNLIVHLRAAGIIDIVEITRETSAAELADRVRGADFVFHLAGTNRPKSVDEFDTGNVGFTRALSSELSALGKPVPVVYTSSIQAALANPYGASKRGAEDVLIAYGQATGAPVHVFRLPNVFGKWSRPNYNSAVATFCSQAAQGQPLSVNDPNAPLSLVYVDDVVDAFLALLNGGVAAGAGFREVAPVYETTVGRVAEIIRGFPGSRTSLVTDRVGGGLERALHATYLSFLAPEAFAYDVPRHADARGEFVEMLKTPDCGQFSYFTAHPGVTRGEHYHHTKTEKFLVISGSARFRFRHVLNGETHEIRVDGGEGRIVETVPGWSHNITNVGTSELVVMLWANEIFDRSRPDTYASRVDT